MDIQPEQTNLVCPICGRPLDIDESTDAAEITCPGCKSVFSLMDDDAPPEPDVAPPAPPAPLPIATTPPPPKPPPKRRRRPARLVGQLKRVSIRFAAGLGKAGLATWRTGKRIFLRLPERAQGAVATALAFSLGIAAFSGHGPTPGEAPSGRVSAKAASRPTVEESRRAEPSVPAKPAAAKTVQAPVPLSPAAKRQMKTAVAVVFFAETFSGRVHDTMLEGRRAERGSAGLSPREAEAANLWADLASGSMLLHVWEKVDVSSCPPAFRTAWKKALDHFSANTAVKFLGESEKMARSAGAGTPEWLERLKERARKNNGGTLSYKSEAEGLSEMQTMLINSVAEVGGKESVVEILAMLATPEGFDWAQAEFKKAAHRTE